LVDSWETIKTSLSSNKIFLLLFAILLIPVNWGLEAIKWQLLVKDIHKISFFKAFEAVLSGVSFSVTLPNRVGEYLGRMMYMPDGSRLRTISASIVGSVAQLAITLSIGTIGLLALKKEILQQYPQLTIWFQFIFYGLVFITILLLFLFFNVNTLVPLANKIIKNSKYLYLIEALGRFNKQFLFQLIFLSFLRYVIFLLQYFLLFALFNVDVSVVVIASVMSVVFLAMSVIPSIALVEIGLRGEVSLKLMGIFSANSLGIGLTTVSVWFMNLIIPAILGSLLLLNIKLIRKNEAG
jgi:uncharacterized membrane protein YbhN (UPF0104 family)